MAEGIAKKIVRPGAAEIRSGGTEAYPDRPAADVAIQAAREAGVDLGKHRTQRVSHELVAWADIIYAPTAWREQQMKTMFPESADKIVQLDALAEISDPIGGDLREYVGVYHRLAYVITERFSELRLV
jgi:protein-tyrosine-phosphatase